MGSEFVPKITDFLSLLPYQFHITGQQVPSIYSHPYSRLGLEFFEPGSLNLSGLGPKLTTKVVRIERHPFYMNTYTDTNVRQFATESIETGRAHIYNVQ